MLPDNLSDKKDLGIKYTLAPSGRKIILWEHEPIVDAKHSQFAKILSCSSKLYLSGATILYPKPAKKSSNLFSPTCLSELNLEYVKYTFYKSHP